MNLKIKITTSTGRSLLFVMLNTSADLSCIFIFLLNIRLMCEAEGVQTFALGTNSGADEFKMQKFFAASWTDITPGGASEIKLLLVLGILVSINHSHYSKHQFHVSASPP